MSKWVKKDDIPPRTIDPVSVLQTQTMDRIQNISDKLDNLTISIKNLEEKINSQNISVKNFQESSIHF